MKLKYYLRGLGIGVVVTAIIMSITNKPQELTDAQIKMRAAELGMVEESVLADLQAEESQMDAVEEMLNEYADDSETVVAEETSAEETSTEQITEEAETVDVEEVVAEAEEITDEIEAVEETDEETDEETTDMADAEIIETEVTTEEVVEADNVSSGNVEITEEVIENFTIINIEKGNGSEVVSRRLYEAGLVESSVEYNQFLVKNGYDRKLSVGNHEIPAGATYDEMAQILCGMR